MDKYNETINFLKEFIDLISQLSFGVKGDWKPFQKGIILTTQSLIDVTEYLLIEKNYNYILGGRFTQDCLENPFSVLHSKHCILDALQIKNNLKLTVISQYIRKVSTSNYNLDDREFLPDFLPTIKQLKKNISDRIDDAPVTEYVIQIEVTMDTVDLNILYYVAGYIITSITKTQKTCNRCLSCVGGNRVNFTHYNRLTALRCYGEKTLFFVNQLTFEFLKKMEEMFRTYGKTNLFRDNINLKKYLTEKFLAVPYTIPHCHNLKQKIASRFVIFKLKREKKSLQKCQKILQVKQWPCIIMSINTL